MNTPARNINLFLLILLFTIADFPISYGAEEENFSAVPTYECIGLYFKSSDLGPFELGRPPIRFGRRAAGNHWPPWELH